MPKKKKKSSAVKQSAKKTIRRKKPTKRKLKVPFIQKGYHCITPYLIINQAANAIEFYKKVFGAKVVMRLEQPNGRIGHAELKIRDTKIMLADECPEMQAHAPQNCGSSPVGIHIYVKDVDKTVAHAVKQGAKLIHEVADKFYGDRSGTLCDPFGHTWFVATHIENVTPAKIRKRAAAMFAKK
ncbi:MAG: VOC family protein [Gammaproteobacteria bacterium]|nr:VOC family protein [Gammaproteobacteria bacterium]